MAPFLILFLASCALALLAILWRAKKPTPRRDLPFIRRASLLTVGELRFDASGVCRTEARKLSFSVPSARQ